LDSFLVGYGGLARDAYARDLSMFIAWRQRHQPRLFQARSVDIECSGRDLESRAGRRGGVSARGRRLA